VSKSRGQAAPTARGTRGPKRRDGSRDRPARNGKAATPHERRFSRTQLLVGVVAAAALVVAALVLVTRLGGSSDASSDGSIAGAQENTALLAAIPQRANVLGSPHAPLTLVEYADLQCPYCATFAVDVLPYLLDDYVRTGKVKLEFRGMAFVGPESEAALRAVAAAGQQNKLWSLTHLLYMNQGMENSGWVDEDFLRAAARSVPGLDADRVLDSAKSDEVTRELTRMHHQAGRDGINSTPSFLLGRSGGTLAPLDVKSLDADAFTSAFDERLS